MSVIGPVCSNGTTTANVQLEAIRRDRTKVFEAVADQIQQWILEDLEPGDALPAERELVRMFGVSRSSVRDAIRKLELLGLVEPRQGSRTVVREPSAGAISAPLTSVLLQKRKVIAELLDLRKMLEPPLARRAAQHVSPKQIAHMEGILDRQESKVDSGAIAVAEDSEFHYCIATAAENSVVLKILDVLMDLLRKTRERSLQTEGRQQKSLAGHRRILAALKQGDAKAAEAAMRQHLSEIEKLILPKL
ncbi:MAG TPA: FadR/GntR family transcriptional regulator [Terriglobales bacterium]|nr:FadR/GntR family transcriptional regulator [Terriglobales bacterium]